MKAFNAFQLVGCFSAAPYGIAYLANAAFPGAQAAFWVAIAAYVISFGCMCVVVGERL